VYSISPHYVSPVPFGKKAYAVRLLLSSSPPTPLRSPHLMPAEPGSGAEPPTSCHCSNQPAQHTAQALRVFLTVNICGLPGTKTQGCSFQPARTASSFSPPERRCPANVHADNAGSSSDFVYSALFKSCFDMFTFSPPPIFFGMHSQH